MDFLENSEVKNAQLYAVALGTNHPLGWCNTVVKLANGANSNDPFDANDWLNVWSAKQSNSAQRWTFMNYGDLKIGDNFGLAHSLYATRATSFKGGAADRDSDKAFSFAVRPYYKLGDYSKVYTELGFYTQTTEAQNGSSVNEQGQKATLAYAISPDGGNLKAKPEFRLYVSYFHANQEAANKSSPSGDKAFTATQGTTTYEHTDLRKTQVVVGAQLEAYW